MQASRCLLIVAVACVGVVSRGSLSAATPNGKVSGDSAAIERVLRGEALAAVDRRVQLEEVLNAAKPAAVARWQAGFVKDGETWQPFESVEISTARQAKIAEYERRRAMAPVTAAGQLELANWCKQNNFPEGERAHLFAVLSADPNGRHDDVLTRLSYRRVGGTWLSREQLLEWQQLNRRTQASLKKFSGRLERIAEQISDSPRDKASTMLALRKLAEPAAIPAMEYTLCGRNEACALVAVDVLSQIAHPDAATTLAKLGVFAEWPAVRQTAARALTSRKHEDFVPQLVSLLSTPFQSQFAALETRHSLLGEDNSKLLYTYILGRETDDQFQIVRFNSVNYTINRYIDGLTVDARDRSLVPNRLASARIEVAQELRQELRNREDSLAAVNERISQINHRIGDVLATVSEQPASSDPKVWWAWWSGSSDVEAPRRKRVVAVDDYEVLGNSDSRFYVSTETERFDCLAAGTSVWTRSGPRPIEEIRIGDLVLAKDIETGELAYKPVLQTTVRPPKELVTLRLDDETIVCTGGHRFWASGSGWVKARDIGSASLMHTARGSTPVWMATKGETAETYNLVVADFHTYFVGKNAVLCQDALIPRPTNKVVPGLDRSLTVAESR